MTDYLASFGPRNAFKTPLQLKKSFKITFHFTVKNRNLNLLTVVVVVFQCGYLLLVASWVAG